MADKLQHTIVHMIKGKQKETLEAEKSYEENKASYVMGTIAPVTRSTEEMKGKLQVAPEQWLDIYSATQKWMQIIKQREKPVDAMQEKSNPMHNKADQLLDPAQPRVRSVSLLLRRKDLSLR